MAEAQKNVVMFPFMAQGHIIPFLALALQIEQRYKYTITFVNTPLNITKIKSSLPSSSSIRLVEIPFDSSAHGLPPDSENTDVLPYPLIIRLLQASTTLRPAFKALIEDLIDQQQGRKPLYIIGDIFFGWIAPIAKELGVFHVIFSVSGAFGLACYYSIWLALPHRDPAKSGCGELELDDFKEASKIHVTQLPLNISDADGTDSWSVFQHENLPLWMDADGLLFNSVEEFDQLGLLYFKRKLNLPALTVGPVLLSTENRVRAGKDVGISPEFCNEWLDMKPTNSVLYVSFGSNNTISPSHMMQLAMALEASGKNFIWVVRPPIGFDINSEFKASECLPEGFEARIKESRAGLLVDKWAPQVEILAHRSTGAFLSQCGWNSVLESLNNGVPLIGWGMAAEQCFNVKFLAEELGVCVEVARGKTSEVRYEHIKEQIEAVMDDTEKGKEMRRKACNLKEVIKNAVKEEDGFKGSSLRNMDDLFQAASVSISKVKRQ